VRVAASAGSRPQERRESRRWHGCPVRRSALNFELSLEPNPRMVSIVRRFVEETFEKLIGDPEAIFRVSMTAHELLENGAKYAVGKRAVLRVKLEERSGGASACIAITNETTPEHVERLKVRVAEISRAEDPFALYQSLMRRSSKLRDESGLGLARIRAEGEMQLGLEVDGNTVTILATATVVDRAP
jgi:hypothetical protein